MNTITTERPQTNTRTDALDSVGGAGLPRTTRSDFADAVADYRQRRSDLGTTTDENAAMDLLTAAERRVLSFVASNVSELRAMAEIIWDDEDSLPPSDMVAKFFASLRNLDKANASPTFDATRWLADYEARGGGWIEREGETLFISADTDGLRNAMWELETRDGADQVKQLIAKRNTRSEPSTWEAALKTFREAKAALDAHQFGKHDAATRQFGTSEHQAYERQLNALSDAHHDAALAVFSTPAPDLVAYRIKVALQVEEQAYQWEANAKIAEALAKDAATLIS